MLSSYICIYTHTHAHTHTKTHTHTHTHTYIYIYIYIFPNARTKTNIFSHTSTHTHNPSNISTPFKEKKKNTNDTTPRLKHRKYHFPPPTITPAETYVPPSSIYPHILLHTAPKPADIIFSRALIIGLKPVHSSHLPRTLQHLLQ